MLCEQQPFNIHVNSAGMNRPKPMVEVTEADFDSVANRSLRSTCFVAQTVSGRLLAEGKAGALSILARR
jgi:NAD(P)-dependent dehydrogenase (short-subunit alcohol dehydrogenase family)